MPYFVVEIISKNSISFHSLVRFCSCLPCHSIRLKPLELQLERMYSSNRQSSFLENLFGKYSWVTKFFSNIFVHFKSAFESTLLFEKDFTGEPFLVFLPNFYSEQRDIWTLPSHSDGQKCCSFALFGLFKWTAWVIIRTINRLLAESIFIEQSN